MELDPKDTYRTEGTEFLSEDGISSLVSLYQPIVGMDAVMLYLTLHSEGRRQKTLEPHSRLTAILNRSIDEIERARIHLEEMMLVRSYVLKGDSKNSYLYHLNAPLSPSLFLENREFYARLVQALGRKNAELSAGKFMTGANLKGYEDITRKISHSVLRDYDNEVTFQQVKPRYRFSGEDVSISFDYQSFLEKATNLIFPVELRTQENMKLIGQMASIYGISPDQMLICVSRACNLSTMTFDEEKLKLYCAKAKTEVRKVKDSYELPPVSFLQSKQNGAQVTLGDKKILEHLSLDMHFSSEVINILVEYVLNTSGNRLVPSFVDSVASQWARDGVNDRKTALAETKKMNGYKSGRTPHRNVLPAYYQKPDSASEQKISEEEARSVEAQLQRMGK